MRIKQSKIFRDTPVSQILTRAVNASHKSQSQITEEAGFDSTNILTMLKQGRTKLPLGRVLALAESLDIECHELMLAALQAQYPEHWPEIAEALHDAVDHRMTMDIQ